MSLLAYYIPFKRRHFNPAGLCQGLRKVGNNENKKNHRYYDFHDDTIEYVSI